MAQVATSLNGATISQPRAISKANARKCNASKDSLLVSGNARLRGMKAAKPSQSLRPRRNKIVCSAAEASTADPTNSEVGQWVPVVPIEALPKGERRLVRQSGMTILMLWYRNEIYAIENTSPAEGAYSEGFINAKLTQDGCIVCPTTSSTYDLKTGEVREWYPNNPVLRLLTPSLRNMVTFPVKIDDFQICIGLNKPSVAEATEVVFGGKINVGQTASDVAVTETRMVVDESEGGFGFNSKNELTNGRAAMIGFVMLLIIEATTGKGLLAVTGFLDFLYNIGLSKIF